MIGEGPSGAGRFPDQVGIWKKVRGGNMGFPHGSERVASGVTRPGTRRRCARCRGRRPGQGHAHLAVRHHVGAVGERDRALGALLDEQHGHAALADPRECVEDDVHDRRGEPERRLVEEQDGRARHERAGDRELLLLTAREHPGLPRPELPDDREQLLDPFAVLLDAVAPRRGRRARGAGSPRRSARRRSCALPGRGRCLPARSSPASCRRSTHRRGGCRRISGRTRPVIACSVVDLPAPFGPISPTISPFPTVRSSFRTAGTDP